MKLATKLLAVTLATIAPLTHAEDLLTGKVKLACEAILCLSTGSPPNECSPSLNEYFSIDYDDFSDTIKGRINFLELCPVSAQTPEMKSLVQAIAHGAGRCDAKSLNATLISYTGNLQGCIQNTKPSYCSAYENHEYTVLNKTQYVVNQTTKTFWPFGFGGNSLGIGSGSSMGIGGFGIGSQGQSQTCGHWVDVQNTN